MLNEVRMIGNYQNDLAKLSNGAAMFTVVISDDTTGGIQAKLNVQIPGEVANELEGKLSSGCGLLINGYLRTRTVNFKGREGVTNDLYVNIHIVVATRITVLKTADEFVITMVKDTKGDGTIN